jgi:cytochrome c oxidase subunit 2
MGTTVLAVLAVVLFFAIIFLVAKAQELSSFSKDAEEHLENVSDLQGKLLFAFLFIGFGGVAYCFYELGPRVLPLSASVHGDVVDSMFNITNIVTILIFILTHIALLSFAYLYRYKRNRKAYFFPHSNKLEIIWTVAPALVLTFLVFRGIKAWNEIFDFESLSDSTEVLVFEATAKQFGWTLRYPGMDGEFGERIIDNEHITQINELGINWEDPNSLDDFMANELYLIKGVPTLARLGAQDVLHGFYLPHFRVKMDCVPGMPTQFMFTPKYTTEEYKEILSHKKYWQQISDETGNPKWQDFQYELACTELCGKSHFAMQRVVYVVTQEEFDAWAATQTPYYYQVINPEANPANKVSLEEEIIEGEVIDSAVMDTAMTITAELHK